MISLDIFQYLKNAALSNLFPKRIVNLFLSKSAANINFVLNRDYKIIAEVIANRLKRLLPKLIDHDQTGFLKGRFIGENIKLVDATIEYTGAKRNIPGLLLFLDFEKAFDTF